ncbi:MAG: nitroreductase family protein [Bacteroidales bacterium]|jgi:nitroreductase|nr:nitroreductase family protein [Bacteroidales bacterium]
MDVLETIRLHRSIRKYEKRAITVAHKEAILRAACNGSTTGNMQLYSIIVTEDKEMMLRMAPYHFNQSMAINAPMILTFCADFNRFNRYCACRDAQTDAYNNLQSYHWAFTDAIIAAQNACVAAESLGIGLCWLGTITFNVDKFIEVLQLPENVIPVACIAFGYPAETPELTDKLPLEALVHHETYHNYSDADIDRLYYDKEHHPNTLQLLKENNLPNLAQIITQRRYIKKDNEAYEQVLIQALKKQCFMH